MSKNGVVRKWLTSIGFNALETIESVLYLVPVAFIPTEEPSGTDEKVWKELFFSQKNAACAHTSRKFLMPRRACPGGVVHDQTSLCKTVFLLSSAVSKSSLGRERSRLKRSLPEQCRCLDTKRTPNRKTLTFTTAVPTAPLSPSCFHAFISYIYLFLWGPTPKAVWYTNLLETLIWSLAARIDHVSQCTSSQQRKMPDKFSSVVHFNN